MVSPQELTVGPIRDLLLAGSPTEGEIDALCLGLEARAADPGSTQELDDLARELRRGEALHLLPLRVQTILQSDVIYQSESIEQGRIHTVCEVRFVGVGADQLAKLIFERPWTWWQRGRISGWQRNSPAGCRFVLWPAWLRSPARVGIDLEAPERSTQSDEGGRSWTRIVSRARFFADFDGPGRYEILEGDEVTLLRSVWEGVARKGFLRLMPASMVLDVHVRAEAGTLRFPFPPGTGFPGLLDHLGAPR